jgi:hypothetical protein
MKRGGIRRRVIRLPQGKRFRATVIDVVGAYCAVRLAQNGRMLRGIPYSGGNVAVGSEVRVDYTSGSPVALVVATGYSAPASQQPIRQRAVESDIPPSGEGFVDEHYHVEADITDLEHDAVKIQGVDVVDTDIGDGKVLEYDSVLDQIVYRGQRTAQDYQTHIEGRLTALTGVGANWIVPRDCTIEKVIIYVEETGSAGNTVVDVHQNGTTIYTVSTKPTIAHDDADGIDSRVPDTTTLYADDVVTFDIDSAATGASGLDIYVVLEATAGGETPCRINVGEVAGYPIYSDIITLLFNNGSVTDNEDGSVWVNNSMPRQEVIFKDFADGASTNTGDYRTWSSGTGSLARNVNFYVPNNFTTLLGGGIWVVIIPLQDSNTQNFDLSSDYGKVGYPYASYSSSANTGVLTLTTSQIYRVDVSDVFSSLEAGHFCGLKITKKVNQSLVYLGLLMVYSAQY